MLRTTRVLNVGSETGGEKGRGNGLSYARGRDGVLSSEVDGSDAHVIMGASAEGFTPRTMARGRLAQDLRQVATPRLVPSNAASVPHASNNLESIGLRSYADTPSARAPAPAMSHVTRPSGFVVAFDTGLRGDRGPSPESKLVRASQGRPPARGGHEPADGDWLAAPASDLLRSFEWVGNALTPR